MGCFIEEAGLLERGAFNRALRGTWHRPCKENVSRHCVLSNSRNTPAAIFIPCSKPRNAWRGIQAKFKFPALTLNETTSQSNNRNETAIIHVLANVWKFKLQIIYVKKCSSRHDFRSYVYHHRPYKISASGNLSLPALIATNCTDDAAVTRLYWYLELLQSIKPATRTLLKAKLANTCHTLFSANRVSESFSR